MKTHTICFLVAGIAALVFLWEVKVIAGLNREYRMLEAKVNEHTDVTSGKNMNHYLKSAFDGFTLGVFAEEGIFTESNKLARYGDALKNAVWSLQFRYETAQAWRNWSLVICLVAIYAGYSSFRPSKRINALAPDFR